MASVDLTNQALQEPSGEPETPSDLEPSGEPVIEDIEQLKRERDQYKRDYAALKKDYDKNAHEAKGKTEPKVETVPEDEIDWKIENAGRIKLVKPELQAYLAKGIPRDEALRLAELDKGITKSSSSDVERQAATSSPQPFVQRATAPRATVTEHDQRFGLSADRKAELAKKYPELAEEM